MRLPKRFQEHWRQPRVLLRDSSNGLAQRSDVWKNSIYLKKLTLLGADPTAPGIENRASDIGCLV